MALVVMPGFLLQFSEILSALPFSGIDFVSNLISSWVQLFYALPTKTRKPEKGKRTDTF